MLLTEPTDVPPNFNTFIDLIELVESPETNRACPLLKLLTNLVRFLFMTIFFRIKLLILHQNT